MKLVRGVYGRYDETEISRGRLQLKYILVSTSTSKFSAPLRSQFWNDFDHLVDVDELHPAL